MSIRFKVLGALSKFYGELHVAEGLGAFLGDPGHIHFSGLEVRGQTAVWEWCRSALDHGWDLLSNWILVILGDCLSA